MMGLVKMRMAIDEFCIAREIEIDNPLAIDAAHHVVGIANQERTLEELRHELEIWWQRHPRREPVAPSTQGRQ